MNRRISSLATVDLPLIVLMAALAGPVLGQPAANKLFSAKKTSSAQSARAIGSYTRGCLAGGRMLPLSGPGWEAMKVWRNRNWGHPQLIGFIEDFARDMKEKYGWPGLLIGDMSQPRGGPMPAGHKSHQIGLDADIWYKPRPDGTLSKKERADSWSIPLAEEFGRKVISKNWKPIYMTLLKRVVSDPRTARIFVHPSVKRKLCQIAGNDRAWLNKVRPWWKHNYHFHLRLKCPPGYEGCKDQKPPPPGDGCGVQLNNWMKLIAKAEKASRLKPKEPGKPHPPGKQLRMADLPGSCRAVLDAAPAGASSEAVRAKAPAAGSTTPAPRTDPNLPWLRGITATPAPARKPQ